MFGDLSIRLFHEALLKKEYSAREATEEYTRKIKKEDGEIGAFLSLMEEQALLEASRVDAMISRGENIPLLAGVPFALKDNILVKGFPATAASRSLETYVASYDASVVERLKANHAVILGKTNLDEFAMGASTENSGFHTTKNPHDRKRVPGGSSGGSAAAVAAGFALAALGSDTGGSIRQPSAFCGVTGLKPTYGAVSRFGLIAMASSLDQIGPIARTAEDAAIVFDAIKGRDPMDATTSDRETPDTVSPDAERIKKLRIGIPREYFGDGMEKEVAEGVQTAIEKFKKAGFSIKEVRLPHTTYALSCYYIVMPAEVSANLARFDGIRYARIGDAARKRAERPPKNTEAIQEETALHSSASAPQRSALSEIYFRQRGEGFGDEVRRRVLLGTFVLSSGYYDAYYAKAQKVRRRIADDFKAAFDDVDVLLTPVTPTRAFTLGEKTDDPLAMYLSDIFTISVNLSGVPALSLPVKYYPVGGGELPVGFQLIGKHFHESDLLGLGMWYERD